jgi:hypothetical protein
MLQMRGPVLNPAEAGYRAPPIAHEIRNRRLFFAAQLAVVLCAMAILYRFDPTSPAASGWFPKCWLYQWTGLYCPGCGTTRSLHALLHGHFLTATHFNPVVTLLFAPIVGWGFIESAIEAIFPGVRFAKREYPRIGLAIAGAVMVFSVLRNLPWQPFCYLAPPAAVGR